MGLQDYLKNKVRETYQNIKEERASNQAQQRELKQQYNEGRKKAEYERGATSGYGRVTEVTEYNEKGKRTKTQKFGSSAQGGSRSGGASWQPDWKAAGNLFGNGGGGGFDIWGSTGNEKKKVIPMETTTIGRDGKVKIQRPYERQNMPAPYDPSNFIMGGGGGMPAGAGPRKKGERDPYDFIL
jgi:hypothetical protein